MFLAERSGHLGMSPKGKRSVSLDPRARLACAFFLGAGVVLAQDVVTVCVWGGLAVLSLLLSRPSSLRAFIPLHCFMGLMWLTVPFSVEGSPVVQWGAFVVTEEGLRLAMVLTVKANASLGFLLAFCGSMDTVTTGTALQGMGVSPSFVLLFMLFCRHLSTLRTDFQMSLHALQLRRPQQGLRTSLYLYACLVGSVLVHATDQAERVRMAMQCKRGALRYESLGRLHWNLRDSMACVLAVILCLSSFGGHCADAFACF